ncbi:histidine kinase dimerization/phosphoacceptor domain -containing protein [Bacterioplanoides sp. SCSIO 12839]|uniref:histidine kinase dimerization/phosphoacceptor domain -containing protein n=1 Tax=Bacterioplanoides sp. SCSIO 12839 TaxID=2829569 RepID=UPI002107372A|nr:histidine kinase dimerization/phosphoacceptor domain -containing protein [Bacterioplanoides sp. SCSIO 12839]UTW47715.1 HAMP domain-containing protein [Bacterioplanoides sp. SCSIO 12839]
MTDSLSRQLFLFISGLTLLLLMLIGVILAPVLVQQVRELDRQRYETQLSHAQLMMSAGAQLSKTIDRFVVESHQAELEQLFAPMREHVQVLEQRLLVGEQTRSQAVSSIVEFIKPLAHEMGNHFWVTEEDGSWIYHPHGQPSEISDYHRQEFRHFIQQVKAQQEASASVPWDVYYLIDSKPLIARYFKALNIIVGMDVDATLLPNSPKDSYLKLEGMLKKLLDGTRFGDHGQAFYLFTNLNTIYTLEGFDLSAILKSGNNPITGNRYLDDFKLAAKQGRSIDIVWNHVDDPKNFIYPATAHVFFEPSRAVHLVSISYDNDLNYQADQVLSEIIITLVFCLFLGVVGAWWLSRRVVMPIKQLSRYAERVGRGDLSLRVPFMRGDELGVLAREFNNMVAKLESTIEGLDRQVQQRTRELDQQNQQLSTAVKDQETLLREVHHRVKNNLAVIIGFIQLQQRRYRGKPTEALLKDLRSRIYTIELIHNQLYRADNLSHVQPSVYYQALIEEIWQLYSPNEKITWSLEVTIEQQSLDQLLTCGQLLNEMLSNSLKYAFVLQESGNIRVQFSQICRISENDIQQEWVKFTFEDDGCGLNHNLEKEGLGFTLIHHLVQNQLKGHIQQKETDRGLCWEIIFPMKK